MVDGPQFYDNDAVFDTYWKNRSHPDNPNDSLEKPVMLEMIGNVKYAEILELGCGDGDFGNLLLAMGCQSYTGIDASRNMIKLAKKNVTSNRANLIRTRIENCEFPPDHYHLIVSRLSLHYVADLHDVFSRLKTSLKRGGKIVLSVEHPVVTASNKSRENGKRTNWIVDDYFKSGKREYEWLEHTVTKYHRTLEDYFTLFTDTGFDVVSLRESKPRKENFTNESEFERRQRIPLMLFFALTPKS